MFIVIKELHSCQLVQFGCTIYVQPVSVFVVSVQMNSTLIQFCTRKKQLRRNVNFVKGSLKTYVMKNGNFINALQRNSDIVSILREKHRFHPKIVGKYANFLSNDLGGGGVIFLRVHIL